MNNSYSYTAAKRKALLRQIADARRNVRSWPKWMRDLAYIGAAVPSRFTATPHEGSEA